MSYFSHSKIISQEIWFLVPKTFFAATKDPYLKYRYGLLFTIKQVSYRTEMQIDTVSPTGRTLTRIVYWRWKYGKQSFCSDWGAAPKRSVQCIFVRKQLDLLVSRMFQGFKRKIIPIYELWSWLFPLYLALLCLWWAAKSRRYGWRGR